VDTFFTAVPPVSDGLHAPRTLPTAADGAGGPPLKVLRDLGQPLAGRRIMQGKINDPRYPENVWAKMQHVHPHPDGTQTVIHYWENLQTGAREGFKFK
jgi:hypothetical protein